MQLTPSQYAGIVQECASLGLAPRGVVHDAEMAALESWLDAVLGRAHAARVVANTTAQALGRRGNEGSGVEAWLQSTVLPWLAGGETERRLRGSLRFRNDEGEAACSTAAAALGRMERRLERHEGVFVAGALPGRVDALLFAHCAVLLHVPVESDVGGLGGAVRAMPRLRALVAEVFDSYFASGPNSSLYGDDDMAASLTGEEGEDVGAGEPVAELALFERGSPLWHERTTLVCAAASLVAMVGAYALEWDR